MSAAAVAEIVLLAVLAGTLGTWIVLRRLAFFSHAVGTATFPGLVAAGSLGAAAPVAGLGTALLAAAGVRGLRGLRGVEADAGTGLVLAAALAAGAIVAGAGAGHEHVEEELFGSLLTVGWGDVGITAAAAALAGAADLARRRRWQADGLDGRAPDLALLAAVTVAVTAAVTAVGALLVGAVLVLPAATARLLTGRIGTLRATAAALAAAQAAIALLAADALGAEAGAALAVLGGVTFAAVTLGTSTPRP